MRSLPPGTRPYSTGWQSLVGKRHVFPFWVIHDLAGQGRRSYLSAVTPIETFPDAETASQQNRSMSAVC
jgi:hypothetical protein